MIDELRNIIDAHGGLELWQSLKGLEIELSARGFLFSAKHVPVINHVRTVVNTKAPGLSLFDYPAVGQVTKFNGEGLVEILDSNGSLLQTRENPRSHFHSIRHLFYWDSLDFAYFCGYATWNYLTMPFLFLEPGVVVRVLKSREQDYAVKLTAIFPVNFPTHCREQDFYFDKDLHLLRHDYTAEVVGSWAKAAHFSEGYRNFSGLYMPTKRRVFPKLIFNKPNRLITLVAIDIHNAVPIHT